MPKRSLTDASTRSLLTRLQKAEAKLAGRYPGLRRARQPVHTVYGGAHLFRADTARKLGDVALRTLRQYAPDPESFGRVMGISPQHVHTVYERVLEKLQKEPVEDFRIDFEDGYGVRSDDEEDGHAASAARQLAAMNPRPPFMGIRVKPMGPRAIRTLDIFLTALGKPPEHFVVTLPKATLPEQVSALADVTTMLETRLKLRRGSIKIEIMTETPPAFINPRGVVTLPLLAQAAKGRCVGAHFGTYDLTGACGIAAEYQDHKHFACDFTRQMMQLAFAGMDVALCDSVTITLPVAVHRGDHLTPEQVVENRAAVYRGWKMHYTNVRHSLAHGIYQGWDIHPAQLPARYAAVYTFFLEMLPDATERMKNLTAQLGKGTLSKAVFDDAASGLGLLNFFRRGLYCGALTEQELTAADLTRDML